MTLGDLIEGVAELLVGLGAGLVVFGLLFLLVVSVVELVGNARRRVCHGRRLRLEQYRAEQALHSIRREAIRDMLEAERGHRYAHNDPDIIEGTAVEVRRW
jgi:hypothetical protein